MPCDKVVEHLQQVSKIKLLELGLNRAGDI